MRQGKCVALVTICTIAVLICGCGGDEENNQGSATKQDSSGESTQQTPATPQAPAGTGGTSGGIPSSTDLSNLATQNREALAKMNQGKQITAVTAATLKELLPKTLAGMTQTDASAERNQMMGMDMTLAEGQYEGQNDASLSLTLTDVGNMSGPMRMGMVGWAIAEYNRETDTGYEKTATYSGFKGMEEYDTESKSGTIRVFVADRFIIELDGSNTTMDTLKQALGQLDLKKIASLASGS